MSHDIVAIYHNGEHVSPHSQTNLNIISNEKEFFIHGMLLPAGRRVCIL